MSRISTRFQSNPKKILSIFFTAGFPKLEDTTTILQALQDSGVDMVEIGIPFSDPLADGPVIQRSSELALGNGMSLKVLFQQLENIRAKIKMPLILMGYLNPVMQFGMENFCRKAAEVGIDGIILPDLPLQEYLDSYQPIFKKHGLSNIFLITPQTSEERIKMIDENSDAFIYMVSSSSTTGKKEQPEKTTAYFERIKSMKLKNPVMVGFGISTGNDFQNTVQYADGAIIGSAFIEKIKTSDNLAGDIASFVKSIRTV